MKRERGEGKGGNSNKRENRCGLTLITKRLKMARVGDGILKTRMRLERAKWSVVNIVAGPAPDSVRREVNRHPLDSVFQSWRKTARNKGCLRSRNRAAEHPVFWQKPYWFYGYNYWSPCKEEFALAVSRLALRIWTAPMSLWTLFSMRLRPKLNG